MNSIVLRIRSVYGSLSKVNRNIADYFIHNLDDVAQETAQEIAKKSNTSPASVIRFAKKMGFAGLEDLKDSMLTEEEEVEENPIVFDPIVNEGDSFDVMSQKIQVIMENSTKDLFYQLDMEKLSEAINLVKHATTIYAFGIGSSSLPAYDLSQKFNRINKTTHFNFDTHLTSVLLNNARKTDVLIVFSYTGRSREPIYATEIAQSKGVPVIAITGDRESRLAKLADVSIGIPENEPLIRVGEITSKINSMIVADLIYLGVVQPHLSSYQKILHETKDIAKRYRE